jgi:hypothetical protein
MGIKVTIGFEIHEQLNTRTKLYRRWRATALSPNPGGPSGAQNLFNTRYGIVGGDYD